MSPIHSDSQAGLSRQGGPCLGLAPGVPQVNTCSRACHHPQPASFSPPQFEPTPTVHLFRPQFRGSTLIPLLLPQPPSSSSANPVSSTLKVHPELASSSSPVLTLLDYYHGPLCPPPVYPGRSCRRPCSDEWQPASRSPDLHSPPPPPPQCSHGKALPGPPLAISRTLLKTYLFSESPTPRPILTAPPTLPTPTVSLLISPGHQLPAFTTALLVSGPDPRQREGRDLCLALFLLHPRACTVVQSLSRV